MAIDPSISLGIRPPVIPVPDIQSPLERFAKVLSLRNLMTQGESNQLGLQSQQLQLQQQQQQMSDEQKLRQLYTTNPNPTHADIISTIGPQRAIPLIEAQSKQYEQQLKTNAQKAARLGQLAGSAVDAPSYQNAIMTAVSEKLMDPEQGRQLSALKWDDPATQAQVKQFQQQALTAEQQHAAALADAEEKRKTALAPYQLGEAQSKARQAALQDAGQTIQTLTDMKDFPAWLSRQPAEAQTYFRGLENMPLADVQRIVGMASTAAKPGETIPLPAGVQQQKVEQQAALGLATEQAKQGFQNQQNEALVRAVMNDPSGVVYANLPGAKQTEIAPILANRGWTQFGAKASDTELTKLQDIQKAIGIAASLKDTLEKNADLIGPVSGRLSVLPYATERKKLQADIDLARQIIGKSLEGGVLRKEDEAKYRNILPTMTDTPEVAQAKLTQLQQLLTRDLGTFQQSLRGAGRQLPAGPEPNVSLKPVSVTDPRGVVHQFQTLKQAEDFKRAAGIQ
jgi:hypothetical protein